MVNQILDQFSAGKSAIASISAAAIGEIVSIFPLYVTGENLETVNIAFQHGAWVVAILAGIVSIVNGTKKWFKK